MLDGDKYSQSASSGQSRGYLSKQRDRKVDPVGSIHGVNSKADDSETQRHSATLGLLSFRAPRPSNTKAVKQKGNADEAAFTTLSNFRHRRHSFNVGPVDSRLWHRQTKSDKIEWREAVCRSTKPQTSSCLCEETCFYHSRRKADSLEGTTRTLSLKEALELLRPDFISRSQERLRRLEQCVKRRKALQDFNPDLVQGLREDRGKPKTNCTTPDPISNNLFKPRVRSISGREMQLRSRRIYNKLPEVTKKKEEEKKRAISQTNRLRAEVFKKKLLDQILQRF
ncbi:Alstrom syndrome protein 1-like [Thalassophryne amazonica]|uniref:Alstrom syndrome protein 1-like n=1 Tax=Thalassophryne amazonica TaxID=390379 RepID=UPI0014713BB5|nr:Alstrom syndrome protein 1-like [Thalassophryne amazonica]